MLRFIQRMVELEWPIRLLGPLIGKFNPFLPEHVIDPYPAYKRLREKHPVYRSPIRTITFSRYRECSAILRDARFSARRQDSNVMRRFDMFKNLDPGFAGVILNNLLMMDPPDHTRIRSLVVKAFTPRMIERIEPEIRETVNELLDAVRKRGGGEMELIRDFAIPLPMIVIARLLGVPHEDREAFKRWSDELAVLLDPLRATNGLDGAQRAYLELADYFRKIFAERRREPRGDLVSALVAAEDEGKRLNEEELLALCGLLLGAGNETTTNLIGNAVFALLRFPEERRRLQADRSLMSTAVDEFLRYDSPVQVTDRMAKEELEISGMRVKKGQMVGIVIGAANRDPERFADPDRLDVGRTDNQHLSFGAGIHYCLGAQLARAEARLAIDGLFDYFPDFTGPTELRRWKPSMVLRGPLELPLRI